MSRNVLRPPTPPPPPPLPLSLNSVSFVRQHFQYNVCLFEDKLTLIVLNEDGARTHGSITILPQLF